MRNFGAIVSIIVLVSMSTFAAAPTSQPATAASQPTSHLDCPIHLGGKVVTITKTDSGIVVRFRITHRELALRGKRVEIADEKFMAARLCEFTIPKKTIKNYGILKPESNIAISIANYCVEGTGASAAVKCNDTDPLWGHATMAVGKLPD